MNMFTTFIVLDECQDREAFIRENVNIETDDMYNSLSAYDFVLDEIITRYYRSHNTHMDMISLVFVIKITESELNKMKLKDHELYELLYYDKR